MLDEFPTEAPIGLVPWEEMQDYERVETVNTLISKFCLSIFSNDALQLCDREIHHGLPGGDGQTFRRLYVEGNVNIDRQALFLKVYRRSRFLVVSDFAADVAPGITSNDYLPSDIWLDPIVDSEQPRAMLRWYRCRWAILCGIVKKIGDTREAALNRGTTRSLLSSGGSSYSANKTMTGYMLRLSAVGSLQKKIHEAIEQQKRFQPLSMYNQARVETRINLHRFVSSTPTVFVCFESHDNQGLEYLTKEIFTSPPQAEYKLGQQGTEDGPDPWMTFVKKYVPVVEGKTAPKRRKKKGTPSWMFRVAKRANIVMVSLDTERDDAVKTARRLREQNRFWRSSRVHMSWTWAGPDGLLSSFGSSFNIAKVPMIMGVVGPRSSHALSDVERDTRPNLPRITTIFYPDFSPKMRSLLEFSMSHNSSSSDNTHEVPDTLKTVSTWVELSREERDRLAGIVFDVLKRYDAPIIFDAWIRRVFPRTLAKGKYLNETDMYARSEVSSCVSMKGYASSEVLEAMRPAFEVFRTLYDFEYDLQVVKNSVPLVTTYDALTPEHRVKGWYKNVTCSHCETVIVTENSVHYRCLQCLQRDGVLCQSCFTNKVHLPHHILVKLLPNRESTIPVLWGPSNVCSLPLLSGKLVLSRLKEHPNVFCNFCRYPMTQVRWKCCMCHEFDLCVRCERSWSRNILTGREEKQHPHDHIFMYVGCIVPGDANQFLQPACMNLEEVLAKVPNTDSLTCTRLSS